MDRIFQVNPNRTKQIHNKTITPHMNEKDIAYSDFVSERSKPGAYVIADLSPAKAHLLHMALGVSGEAGELVDAIKKHAIYGKSLDQQNVIEECGDLLFYIQGILNELNLTISEVMDMNVRKLSQRYPVAYSNDLAIARADKEGQ